MLVLIKGAGDLASGVALRLFHAGFKIIMTELAAPLAVRRTVSFSQAVYDGSTQVEDITALLVKDDNAIRAALERKQIPVLVDPSAAVVKRLRPTALVDGNHRKPLINWVCGQSSICEFCVWCLADWTRR